MSKNVPLQPLADRVVLEVASGEQTTESGIYIPDSAKEEKPVQATVVAVGPGKVDDGQLVPMQVKVGDTVIFSKYAPDEVEVKGQKYMVIREDSILAIVN